MSLARSRLRALFERTRLIQAGRLEARLRRSAAVRGAAIVFHAVGPRAGDPERELDPPIAVAVLDATVGYLARHYSLVRAGELPSVARARKPGEPVPIAFTFDDDLPSHLDYAAPAFERHAAIATAFLCGNRSAFWFQLLQIGVDNSAVTARTLAPIPPRLVEDALQRQPGAIARLAKAIEDLAPAERDRVARALADVVQEPPPVLPPEGAAALAAAGWEIGFHTQRHDLLTALGDDALRKALARRPIDPDGAQPRTLAYPHGKAAAREADAARRAGYVAAFTGYPHAFTEETDDYLIGRLQPDTSSLGRFALHLARSLSTA